MKSKFILCLLCMLSFNWYSCDKELSQEEEFEVLQEMLNEIEVMATSEDCTDASEWAFTAIGSKACGGPHFYLAYPTTIDTTKFLEMVNEHKEAEDAYNIKWSIISDCSLPAQPTDVICENNEPVFVY